MAWAHESWPLGKRDSLPCKGIDMHGISGLKDVQGALFLAVVASAREMVRLRAEGEAALSIASERQKRLQLPSRLAGQQEGPGRLSGLSLHKSPHQEAS